MHAVLRESARFGYFKTLPLGSWNSGSSRGQDDKNPTGIGNTLKFLAALPLAVAMFLINLTATAAAVVVSLLLIPLAILTPVLVVAALILFTGEIVQFSGGN